MRISHKFKLSLINLLFTVFIAVGQTAMAQDPSADAQTSAAASSAPSEAPIYSTTLDRDNALLAAALKAVAKEDEIQWLETPEEKILSLIKIGETRKTKGALLIMHAPESPQFWPANLETLRRNLPIYGWATMALPLPAKYSQDIPNREVTPSGDIAASSVAASSMQTSSVAASEPSKPLLPRDQIIAHRVDAAIAQLNKAGQFNIVVMVDNSCAPDALAGLLKKINSGTSDDKTIDGPMQALILMNLQYQEALTKPQLAQIFSSINLPVMDVFVGRDDKSQVEARRIHHAVAMQQNLKDYRQFILLPEHVQTLDDKQGFWLEATHGFMERKAEGMEFKQH